MSDKSHKQHPETHEQAATAEDAARSREEVPSTPDPAAGSVDEAAAADVGAAAPPETEQTSSITLVEAQLEEARDRNLRLQAELENVRKRMLRTVEEERRYACLPLMRDLLPVVDNLQRAIETAEQHENAAALRDGVKLVISQLNAALQRHHCVPIEAEGAVFDPHVHEAIAQLPSPDHEPGQVCLVTQAGYQLHDRVVRPAQVIVAAPREAPADVPEEPSEPET